MGPLSQQVLFRQTIDVLPDPATLSRWDDGRIVAANEAFLEHLGLPRSEVLGTTIQELPLEMPTKLRADYEKQLTQQGAVRDFKMVERLPDGRKLHVLLSSSLIEFEGTTYNLTVGKDITQLIET